MHAEPEAPTPGDAEPEAPTPRHAEPEPVLKRARVDEEPDLGCIQARHEELKLGGLPAELLPQTARECKQDNWTTVSATGAKVQVLWKKKASPFQPFALSH